MVCFRALARVVTAVSLAACSAAPDAADEGAEEGAASAQSTGAFAQEPVPRSEVPEPEAFKGWSDDLQSISAPRPADVERVSVDCADKQLYPTHPSSSLKQYHRYAHGRYDHFKLSNGASRACMVPQNRRDPASGRCLSPDTLDYALLSDTFMDACGNRYRGYWDELYFRREETMGTLMSKGRRVYDVPGSRYGSVAEVYDAGTYAVSADDFAFLGPLLDGDDARISRARASASATHRFDEATHLFTYVGPHR